MELGPFRKVQRLQLHDAVFLAAVCDVNALIDGKAVDFTILVINVRTEWADAVRAKGYFLSWLDI